MTASISAALLGLHAQTSLHPGAGTALGTVDLPIQRERHTQWPIIAGSAVKGVLRDAYREALGAEGVDWESEPRWDDQYEEEPSGGTPAIKKKSERKGTIRAKADATLRVNLLFGPPTEGSSEFAGAMSITDARILAFPLRSLRGVFAWVTCPAVLDRLLRDARLAGRDGDHLDVPSVGGQGYVASPECDCRLPQGEIVLEDSDFKETGDAQSQAQLREIAVWISANLLPKGMEYQATRERFAYNLVLLSDSDFTHFVRHSTEVAARIGLDYETKTVKTGALFYQEFLPPETLLYSVVLCNQARLRQRRLPLHPSTESPFELWRNSVNATPFLQLGGDETTGKGWCAVRLSEQGVNHD